MSSAHYLVYISVQLFIRYKLPLTLLQVSFSAVALKGRLKSKSVVIKLMFVSDKLAGMDLGFRYGCPSQNKTAHLWFVLFSWMWTACLLSGGLITLTGWWFKLQEAFPNYLFLIKLDAMGTCSFSTSCECS